MTISNNVIENAIYETLIAHPNYCSCMGATMKECLQIGVVPIRFTKNNGARDSIRNLTKENLLKYILEETVSIYSAMTQLYPGILNNQKLTATETKKLKEYFPDWEIIRTEVKTMLEEDTNLFNLYQLEPNRLFSLTEAVMKTRFNSRFFPLNVDAEKFFEACYNGQMFRQRINNLSQRDHAFKHLYTKINKDYEVIKNISDIRINYYSLNKCLSEVMDGSQIKHRHQEYSLDGNLFATQDIGRKRTNQEDSTIIMTHPQNSDFKLIAVADGMGGGEYGEQASNYTIKTLSEWFQTLPLSYYDDYESLYPKLRQIVQKISDDLYQKYRRHGKMVGTTLVGAIVGLSLIHI